MTPQINCLGKVIPVLRVSTHIYEVFEEIDGKCSEPRHVTPQIDHLGKMSTVLRISTHSYGIYQELDGKTFIFRVILGM